MTRVEILDRLHKQLITPGEARDQLITSGLPKEVAKAIMTAAMYGMGADKLKRVLVLKLRPGDACRAQHPVTGVFDLCSVVRNNGSLLWLLLRERDGALLHRYAEHVYLPEIT